MAIFLGDKEVTLGYLGDLPITDITQPRSAICGECTPYLAQRAAFELPGGNVTWTSCYDNTTTFTVAALSVANQHRFYSSTYPVATPINPGEPFAVSILELINQGWDSNPCTVFDTPLNCEQYTLTSGQSNFMHVDYFDCVTSEVTDITLSVIPGYSQSLTICAQSGSFSLLAGVTISGSVLPCPGSDSLLFLDATNPSSYPGSGSVWYDMSGNGNNANLLNSLSASWDSDGYFPYTASLPTSRAEVPSNASINTFGSGSDFSLVVAFQWDGVPYSLGWGTLASKPNPFVNPGFGFIVDKLLSPGADNKILAYVNDDGVSPSEGQVTSGTYTANEWIITTFLRNSSDDTLKIYIDNELRSSRFYSGSFDNASNFVIGSEGNASTTLNGKIAVVGAWNKTLSTDEIAGIVTYYKSIL
jgi:hypothetical protein